VKKFDPVQNWIDNVAYSHSKSEGTEYKYRYNFGIFCDFIEKTPKQILEEYERMTDREFRRKYALYVRAFISHLAQKYAVGTVTFIVASIKSFFKYNDLPLGHVPMARCKVTYHNRDITKEEIVKILEISRPRDKAFLCMMAQTGLRPSTLSNLKIKYIQPDFDKGVIPCKVDVPQEIAKGQYRSYFTFMGEESVKYLKAYLSTRPGIGSKDYLFTSHGSDKQLDRRSMSHIFIRAITKLKQKGLMDFEQKQKGKPRNVRLYSLRKYFRKMAHQTGFEIVQFFMGHVVKEGVEEHYRPKDVEFYRQLYEEKAMPYLRFETATPSETEQTIMELRGRLEGRDREMEELRSQNEALGNEIANIKQTLQNLQLWVQVAPDSTIEIPQAQLLGLKEGDTVELKIGKVIHKKVNKKPRGEKINE